MKRILWMIFLLANVVVCRAQITGRVVDEENLPIEFVNVVLLTRSDSSFVEGIITKEDGTFRLENSNMTSGILSISYIGYATFTKNVPPVCDVGTIVMQMENVVLQDVEVKGMTPLYKMTSEGIITNVEGTVLSRLGTLEDVLSHVPGIEGKNGSWRVFGRGTPIIYLNGRQVYTTNEIINIKSEDVKSVEVIRNPGPKYPASVHSVIKIRTIRPRGEGLSVDAYARYDNNKYSNTSEQITLNYRKNGFDAFLFYKYGYSHSWHNDEIEQTTMGDTLWNQLTDYRQFDHNEYHTLQGGFYYEFGKQQSIGLRYWLSISGKHNSAMATADHTVLANDIFYDNISSTTHQELESRPTHYLNAYYNGKVGSSEIDFNFDFYHINPRFAYTMDEHSEDYDSREFTTYSPSTSAMEAAKLSLVTPILGGNLSYGAEFVNVNRRDSYESSRTDIIGNSYSKIKENTTSVYAEYDHDIPIGEVSLGVRYEHVGFKYYENGVYVPEQSRTFNNVFPKVGLNAKIGHTMWQIAYTVKASRPNFRELSVNTSYNNRFLLQRGNPLLKNQTDHNVSLAGVWKFCQLALEYTDSRHAIIQWADQVADNQAVTILTWKNQHSIKNMTLFLSAAPEVSFWSPQISGGMVKQWLTLETDFGTYRLNKPIFMASFKNVFTLPWDMTFNLDFSYQSTGNSDNVLVTKHNYILDIALRKQFFHRALTIQLKGEDLLHQSWASGLVYNQIMQLNMTSRYGSRLFSISARYTFNTSRSKYKGTGAGDEVRSRL